MRKEWQPILDGYFKNMDVERDVLDGAVVWLGRSSAQPASGLADDITSVLESAGAKVSTGLSGCGGLIDGQEAERLADSHAVMMLAATPGVAAEAIDFCKDEHWGKPVLPRMHILMPTEHSEGYIHYRLRQMGANLHLYGANDVDDGKLGSGPIDVSVTI